MTVREGAAGQAGATPEIPPLRYNRNYRWLWLGQAVSLLGDEVFETAIVLWLGIAAAGGQPWGPIAAAGALGARTVPVLLIGPLGGVYADRWDRRRTMLAMDAFRCVLVLGLAVFLLAGAGLPVAPQLAVIYLTVALGSAAAQFFNPSRYALLATVVADADRERMGSIMAGTGALAAITGPALAALLLVLLNVQWSLLITAAGFAVSFFAVARIRVVRAGTEPGAGRKDAGMWRELGTGLRFFAGNRVLTIMLVTTVMVEIGIAALVTLDIFFVTRNLHAPPQVYGWLGAAFGFGSLAGAGLAAVFAPRLRAERVYAFGFALSGLILMAYSRMTAAPGALLVLFLLGIPVAAVNSMIGPLIMRATPQHLMGRVSAVFQPSTQLAALLSTAGSAWLASSVLRDLDATVAGVHFGTIDTIFLVAGALIAVTGLWTAIALRRTT